MQRVSVVGSTGTGKTTFARELAGALGVPCVELDALFWGPRWTPVALETFRERVAHVAAIEAWVIDGNYGGSGAREIVWTRADTVVWLDYSLPLLLWRLVRRILSRIRDGSELWPGTGDRETVRNAFFARDSLLWFAVRTYRGRRRRLPEALARPEYAHLTTHRFRDPREAERWLAAQRVRGHTRAS